MHSKENKQGIKLTLVLQKRTGYENNKNYNNWSW